MAKKKQERTTLIFEGITKWPKLDTPDVYVNPKNGKKGEPKYKTNVEPISDDELTRVIGVLKKFAAEKFDDVSEAKLPLHEDKKTKEISVPMSRSAKLGPAPVFDARNNKLPPDVQIGGGSHVRVHVTLNDYDEGVNLYLNSIQVLKLEEPTFGKSPFEETEGYAYEGNVGTPRSPFGGEEAADDEPHNF